MAFEAAQSEERAALMPYMVAGYPDTETSLAVARTLVAGGADLVEVGVPFSDPLADGPVIHEAATRALDAGATLETAFAVAGELGPDVPAVLMCYSNMILSRGAERFAAECADAGIAGVIVPDLPHGQAPDIEQEIRNRGMATIPLIAPTTTPERRAAICEHAEGFVYLVSTVGTTGVRQALPDDLAEQASSVREAAEVPVAVGFGVGTPEQAADVGRIADGVIIGSRLVQILADEGPAEEATARLAEFLEATRAVLGRARAEEPAES